MYVRVHNVQLVQLSITLPTVKKSCIRVYCIYTVYIYKQYIIPDELCTCIFVLAYRKGNKWSVWVGPEWHYEGWGLDCCQYNIINISPLLLEVPVDIARNFYSKRMIRKNKKYNKNIISDGFFGQEKKN